MKSRELNDFESLKDQVVEFFYTELLMDLKFYCFRMKSENWEYENEYRFVSDDPGFISIPGRLISEIIFGLKMTLEEKRTIENILNQQGNDHINYKEVAYSEGSFKFAITDYLQNDSSQEE